VEGRLYERLKETNERKGEVHEAARCVWLFE